tara:strand:- start:200 stop:616 length:417 start_codon:yes stop_codon:yes gene_type:complete
MRTITARDRFYAPLRRMASDYLPLLLGRMRILEQRAETAMEFLDCEGDEEHEVLWGLEGAERVAAVAEAQSDLHKSVLEAGTCQQLVHAFGELLQEDYRKIRDNGCYYVGPDGRTHSLYDVQRTDDDSRGGQAGITSG